MNEAREFKLALKEAQAAAREAGALIRRRFGRPQAARKKGAVNLVTATDLACERLIVRRLRRAFPDHAILAEEEGRRRGRAERLWIIDPLDGTTNFAHGYPAVSVSIALLARGEAAVGAVYDPLRDELFHAVRGGGAWRGRKRLKVSATRRCGDGLATVGFPYVRRRLAGRLAETVKRAILNFQGVRRGGSACLDFCGVAAGRLDAFFEERLHPWDMAAGALIVAEAGGRVTTFAGGTYHPWVTNVLATNGRLHAEAIRILRPITRQLERP